MNNFIRSYEIILHHLQELQINATLFKQIRQPKLSNIELVAMNFTAEYMGIDSECQLFRTIESSFLEPLIDRSVYNRRRRKLFPLIEKIRRQLSSQFNEFEDYYVIKPDFRYFSRRFNDNGVAKPVPEDFEYNSGTNSWWLTVDELRTMIDNI